MSNRLKRALSFVGHKRGRLWSGIVAPSTCSSCSSAADALWWLTGVGLDRYLNRVGPLAAALDESWQAMALEVLHAPNDEDRVKRIEKFLEPSWHAARSRDRAASWGPAQRHGEWSRAAMSRAHIFSKGRSRRQLERQMRTMTGWSARAEGACASGRRSVVGCALHATTCELGKQRGRSWLCGPIAPLPRIAPLHWLQPEATLAARAKRRRFVGLQGVVWLERRSRRRTTFLCCSLLI